MGTVQTTVQTAASKARRLKAVVEYKDDGREWWVMHNNGRVEAYDTAGHALRAVQKYASRGNRGLTLTTVEWRNVPDGWKPPQP